MANKKEAVSVFLEKIVQYKSRTIKILLRDILSPAIEHRHGQGDPVLEQEAIALAEILDSIGIDMKKEILALCLPRERPKVVPPPIQIQHMLDNLGLHPFLLPDCLKLFKDGHINETVRKALEKFEVAAQKISSSIKYSKDLIGEVFSEKSPLIKLNALQSREEINDQGGFKFISMGIIVWWRNNLSHGDVPTLDHLDAVGRLLLVSNLLHKLGRRTP